MDLQNKASGRESPHRDRWVTAFETPAGDPANKEPRGHVRRGYPALAPRNGDLAAELAEGGSGWQGERIGGGRPFNVSYEKHYVD